MPKDASRWAKMKRKHRAYIRWASILFIALEIIGFFAYSTLLSYVNFFIAVRVSEVAVRAAWRRITRTTVFSFRVVRDAANSVEVEDLLTPEEQRDAIDNIASNEENLSELPDGTMKGLK